MCRNVVHIAAATATATYPGCRLDQFHGSIFLHFVSLKLCIFVLSVQSDTCRLG
jgi:hypothetical protein